MAKSITTQYRIQTERAIANVNKLTESIKTYNREVKATNKVQASLNQQAGTLKKNLSDVNKAVGKLVTKFKDSANQVSAAVREIKAYNKATEKAKKATSELQQQFKNDKKIANAHLRAVLKGIDDAARAKTKEANDDLKRRERLDKRIAQAYVRSVLKAIADARSAKEKEANDDIKRRERTDKRIAQAYLRSVLKGIDDAARAKEREARNDIRRRERIDKRIAEHHLRTTLQAIDAANRAKERQAREDLRRQLRLDAQIARAHIKSINDQLRRQQRLDARIARAHLSAELQRIAAQAEHAERAVRGLNLTMFELRVAVGVLISRAVSEFVNRLGEAVDGSRELTKRIAEVQTVSLEYRNGALESAKATNVWQNELLALSRSFGVPVLETTEALYEALSNQVIEAGNSTNFMAQEMKLAITTVSTLDEAVDTTSTVINAFRKNVAETARVNAVLFKAVDVGRFRLNELGSQFGRVSVLSNELRISFEEQAAAIALLTRLGLNADVAQTLLTNVQLKLIKPTETMVELFNKWGVTSGQAAIQTFGFAGVLRKLAAEANSSNDPMQELGEIFQDLRAITGAQGLVANFDLFESTLREVTNSTEAFNKAFDLSMESLGRKADIEVEKVRQLLLVQFGEPFLRLMLRIADSAGGADKAIGRLIKTFIIGGTVFLSYRTALNLVNSAVALHAGLTVRSTAATTGLTAATTAATAATTGLSAAQGVATAGLTILISALALTAIRAKTMRAEFEAGLAVLRSNLLEQARRDLDKLQQQLGATADAQIAFNNATFRSYFLYVANMRALNTTLTDDFKKKFEAVKKSMTAGLDVSTDIITERIRALTDELEKARKVVSDLKDDKRTKELDAVDKRIEFDLKEMSPEDALREVVARKRGLEADAMAALRKGELDVADELFKRAETWAEEAEDRLRDLVKATKDAAVEIRHHLEADGDVAIAIKDGDVKGVARRKGPKRKKGDAPAPDVAIDVKEEIVDLEKVEKLEEALVVLEEERRAAVADRLALERTILATKEAEAKALEAELAKREKAFEDFKRLVAEMDAFDASAPGAAVNFDALVVKTEAAGKAAGLTPAEQFQFLRQAFAQRILLAREAATAAAKAQLDIEQKALEEGTRLVEEAIRKRQAAAASVAEGVANFATKNLENAARLENELGGFGRLSSGADRRGLGKDKEVVAARAAVAEFERLNQQLLDAQRNGRPTADILAQIAEAQTKLAEALERVNAIGRKGESPVARPNALIGATEVDRNAAGELLFPKEAGKAEESLSDLVEDSTKALQQLRAEFGAAAAAQKEFEKAAEVMNRLKKQAELIPEEIRKQAEAAEDAGKRSVTAQEAVNRVLNGTLTTLEAIRQKHLQIIEMRRREAEAIEAAGPVVPRAHGGFVGRGTDRHLVALSGGEHVSTRLTTRQYGPLLRALGSAPPLFRAQGGDTNHNYGDINIHPKSGVSDGIVTEVAQKLQRLQRRGLFSLKG